MAREIVANVVINAVARGFDQIGSTLTQMGYMIDGFSRNVIDFGKDSVNVYRDYEKSMIDAEIALATSYGRNTRELKNVMSQLDVAATEWAATTVFHTNDVANAISEAAHAGWDLEEIMTGIPAAIELAQAGGMDLSTAVNYVVKSTNALGLEFGKTTDFIDVWTYAANSSASTVGEFGDAMLRMGSTMKFAANPEELMTLLAVTANAGTVGEAAGTLLRNTMIRLVAPTKKASDAMAELGATSDEMASIVMDEGFQDAYSRLETTGFSVYDEQGNLKSMLDIFSDLYVSLGLLNGGFEGLEDNEDVIKIISAIFPTRTLQEGLNLLNAAAEGYGGLYEQLTSGEAEGYAAYASERETDSLWGAQELFISKMERLKQVTGAELAGQLEEVYGWLGGIIDKVAEMDPDAFSELVRAFEVLAVAGPGLIIAGKAISLLANPVGLLALSAVGLGMAVAAFERMQELDFESKFGEMELDPQPIVGYINSIGDAFRQEYAEVDEFNQLLEAAFTQYNSSASELRSELVTSMLSHTTLSGADKENMMALGEQMCQALVEGIDANYSSVMASMTAVFTDGTGAMDSVTWNTISDLMVMGFEEDIAKAESLSKQLRDALTSAFEDGQLTGEEIEEITNIMKQMNDLMAMQYDHENYTERSAMMRKAQTVGFEQMSEIMKLAADQRDKEMERIYAMEDSDLAWIDTIYDKGIANGYYVDPKTGHVSETYLDGYMLMDETQREAAKAKARTEFEAKERLGALSYDQYIMGELAPMLLGDSDLTSGWDTLSEMADVYASKGGYFSDKDIQKYSGLFSGKDAAQTGKLLLNEIEMLGGVDEMAEQAAWLWENGYGAEAEQYQHLLDMYSVFSMGSTGWGGKFSLPGMAHEDFTQYGTINAAGTEDAIMALLEGTAWASEDNPLEALYNAIVEGGDPIAMNLGLVANARAAGYLEGYDDNPYLPYAEFERQGVANMLLAAMGLEPGEQLAQEQEPAVEPVEEQPKGMTSPADFVNAYGDAANAEMVKAVGEAGVEMIQEGLDYASEMISSEEPESETLVSEAPVSEAKASGGLLDYATRANGLLAYGDPISGITDVVGGIGDAAVNMMEVSATRIQEYSENPALIGQDAGFGALRLGGYFSDLLAVPLSHALAGLGIVDAEPMKFGDTTFGPYGFAYGMPGGEQYAQRHGLATIDIEAETDNAVAQTEAELSAAEVTIEPEVETEDIQSAGDEPVTVEVGADTSPAEPEIASLDDEPLTLETNADISGADADISTLNGRVVTVLVNADISAAAGAISGLGGGGTMLMAPFAEGGRATMASIFGEAGPEWAIPEQHTDRTAELLNAARAASGFTWPELLERFGGLNGSTNNTPTTLVYSPTIHAADARGVDQALLADKSRLEKWWEEKKTREAVEVYA